MKPIAVFPYYKIQREVQASGLVKWEDERYLYLYPEELKTKHRSFSVEQIRDLSYRAFDDGGGILYLHTIGGVFTYFVKTSPQAFIDRVKSYINTL